MPLDPQNYNTKQIKAVECYADPRSETFGHKLNSYLKAGYSNSKSAEGNAIRFFNSDRILTAIRQYKAEIDKKMEVSRDYVLKELQALLNDCKNEDGAYVDKTNANSTLRLLGQSIAMFTDKIQTEDVSDSPRPEDALEESERKINEAKSLRLVRETG